MKANPIVRMGTDELFRPHFRMQQRAAHHLKIAGFAAME
jgi:hypothetical protein